MSADTNGYEARVEAAQQAYMSANGREPQDTDWGLLTTDDGGGSPAPSHRLFAWFETREQLLDFIASELILSASEPPEQDEAEPAIAEAAALVSKVRAGAIGHAELVDALADRVASSQVLNWVGTFEELCTGDGAEVRRVRSEYWWSREDDHDEDGPQPPIEEDDREDFVEFLQTYGA